MHDLGRADDTESVEEETVGEEGETGTETERRVDTKVPNEIPIVSGRSIVRRPVLEPEVRTNRQDLLDDDGEQVEKDLAIEMSARIALE